jgi:hypothetical protein
MTIQLPAVASLLSRWQLVERSWTETDPIDCAAKPFSDAELIRKFERGRIRLPERYSRGSEMS